MTPDLKPLDEQVIVITGATSGIGLTTARMAAERGARLVLAARGEEELSELVDEITKRGGDAVFVVADVRNREDVSTIAEVAEDTYGGFDTWVNVAGAFLYGRLDETPIEDMRAQFDTNVWGLLYGSLEAADRLETRGGAIVNLGSVVSDRAMPLQGSYSASKHAVKGFTDALRMELEEAGTPVSVTLVKPAAIDTPYPEHAKNYMDEEASFPPPVYEPEVVARAILDAAENPQRDVYVGGGAKGLSAVAHYMPRLLDRFMERTFFDLQRTDRPSRRREENNLDDSTGDLEARGDYEGHVASTSLYTRLSQRKSLLRLALVGLGLVGLALYARYGRDRSADDRQARAARTDGAVHGDDRTSDRAGRLVETPR